MEGNNLDRLFEINKEYSGQHVLKRKAIVFAVKILELAEVLSREHKAYRISDQLTASGTSIGANSSEADHGFSKADFIYKLSTSHKEAAESKYWLSLCFAKGYINEKTYTALWSEAHELYKIISSSLITARSNPNKR